MPREGHEDSGREDSARRRASAWDVALQLLGVRARSRSEMCERLARRGFSEDEVETTMRVARNAWSNALACAVGASVGRWGTLFQCSSEEAEELQIGMAGFTSYAETVSVYGTERAFTDGDDTPWSKAFLAAAYASRGVKMRCTSGAASELLMGFHESKSLLYLEARCLCLQRGMGAGQRLLQGAGFTQAALTLTAHRLGGIEAATLQLGQLSAAFQFGFGTHQAIPLGLLGVGDFAQIPVDLATTLFVARPCLIELEHIHLLGMDSRLERLDVATEAAKGILQACGERLRLADALPREPRGILSGIDLRPELIDLPLALDHAVGARIRGIVNQRMAAQKATVAADQSCAGRQFVAPVEPHA